MIEVCKDFYVVVVVKNKSKIIYRNIKLRVEGECQYRRKGIFSHHTISIWHQPKQSIFFSTQHAFAHTPAALYKYNKGLGKKNEGTEEPGLWQSECGPNSAFYWRMSSLSKFRSKVAGSFFCRNFLSAAGPHPYLFSHSTSSHAGVSALLIGCCWVRVWSVSPTGSAIHSGISLVRY